MSADELLALAATVKAMRQAANCCGTYLKGVDVEVLLWVAAGIDTVKGLATATELTPSNVGRSVRFLSGRTVNRGVGRNRRSPFRLLGSRPHPHQSYPEQQIYLTNSLFSNERP